MSAVFECGLVLVIVRLFFTIIIVVAFDIGHDTDCEDFANGGIGWYLPGKAEPAGFRAILAYLTI